MDVTLKINLSLEQACWALESVLKSFGSQPKVMIRQKTKLHAAVHSRVAAIKSLPLLQHSVVLLCFFLISLSPFWSSLKIEFRLSCAEYYNAGK